MRLLATLVSISLLLSAPTFAAAQESYVEAKVAPTVGQSVLADTEISRAALRFELGGEARGGGFTAGGSIGLTHFLTERPEDVRDVAFGDLTVFGAYDAFVAGPLIVRPRLDVVLPASAYSRDLTMYFGSHLGVDTVFDAGPLSVTAIARVRRDVHAEKHPELPISSADEPHADPGPYGFRTAGWRLPGREEPTMQRFNRLAFTNPSGDELVLLRPANNAWASHLGVLFEGTITGGWFVELGFGWTHTWTYVVAAPSNVIATDRTPRRQQRNIHTGVLGGGVLAPVGPLELGFRLGFTTSGAASNDEGRARFPFWNFDDPSLDDSVLDLQLMARY